MKEKLFKGLANSYRIKKERLLSFVVVALLLYLMVRLEDRFGILSALMERIASNEMIYWLASGFRIADFIVLILVFVNACLLTNKNIIQRGKTVNSDIVFRFLVMGFLLLAANFPGLGFLLLFFKDILYKVMIFVALAKLDSQDLGEVVKN